MKKTAIKTFEELHQNLEELNIRHAAFEAAKVIQINQAPGNLVLIHMRPSGFLVSFGGPGINGSASITARREAGGQNK